MEQDKDGKWVKHEEVVEEIKLLHEQYGDEYMDLVRARNNAEADLNRSEFNLVKTEQVLTVFKSLFVVSLLINVVILVLNNV
jgi:hypothetical protein